MEKDTGPKVDAELSAWGSPGVRDVLLTWSWGNFANNSVCLTVMPTSAQPGPWECPEEDREASNLGSGARKRAAEKRNLDTLIPGTVGCTLSLISRAKGIPRRALGTGVTRSSLWVTSCNLGIFCVGVLRETDDGEQLLANQIWVCLWEHS